jgi:RNA polymerase sigma factor (sigma-70 family)
VKIRAQPKKVDGKPRWYLVRSYRNDAGKSRTQWLSYLGEPPTIRLRTFIARVNKDPCLELFLPFAIENVKRHVLYLRAKRKWQRNQRIPRLKRRRDLYAAHKAGMPVRHRCPIPKNPKDPLSEVRRLIWLAVQALELLVADLKYRQVKNWSENQKQELRLKLAPTLKAIDERRPMLERLINGKYPSKSIRLPVQLADKTPKMYPTRSEMREKLCRKPTDEEPEDMTDKLKEMLRQLDQREATIIRDRFGPDDGTQKTLAEIGRKFGVTRERVRQIQELALRKLRYRYL